jgi:glycosyltransferase involved in cell wall biosynthesis
MNSSDIFPLISCLCVTRNKVEFLSRSISCFESQTYPHKELIIVYESDDLNTRQLLHSVNSEKIKPIELLTARKMPLGDIRNTAIEKSSGEYLCQWDDDDWYHERRLEIQMKAILNSFKPASALTNWIVFNAIKDNAYISPTRIWEGSILFRKDIISDDIRYESVSKGEDTILINKMLACNYIYPVLTPSLYIYVFHGKNTFGEDHFQNIFDNSQKLSDSNSLVIKHILNGKFDHSTGSKLLSGKDFLEEIDYFFSIKRINMLGHVIK